MAPPSPLVPPSLAYSIGGPLNVEAALRPTRDCGGEGKSLGPARTVALPLLSMRQTRSLSAQNRAPPQLVSPLGSFSPVQKVSALPFLTTTMVPSPSLPSSPEQLT